MELTRENVAKIARLSRLSLSDEELDRFTEQLGEILDYVQLLNEVDTSGVEPMAHAGDLTNVFREDEPHPSLPRDQAFANAPKSDGKYFLVPPILETGE
ncbi:MAG: Asp-tRNA(Asn)/Glu-tRNA(Gln) amidotransferase subunit GatC [Planctomycetaceae bacterium]|nr:Asp-tRNA(Asn)/Glu-tRNA(Gln) amidotransferase subunit GatC [Planctomycetaceae bacterium]